MTKQQKQKKKKQAQRPNTTIIHQRKTNTAKQQTNKANPKSYSKQVHRQQKSNQHKRRDTQT